MDRTHADDYRVVLADTVQMLADAAASGDEPVPACPGWTVADVVRHLAGLAHDWTTGELEVYASPDWTNRHVTTRSADGLDAVVDEWQRIGGRLAEMIDHLDDADHLPDVVTTVVGPAPLATFPDGIVIDALQHQFDLAAALGLDRPTHPSLRRLTRVLIAGSDRRWRRAEHPPYRVVDDHGADVGRLGGASTGASAGELRASVVDIFRSLGGRRTLEQIAALDWRPRPPEPALADLVVGFFAAPSSPVDG